MVRRLEAAPGCGKTLVALLLLNAAMLSDEEQCLRRVHWFTAPTKQLVSEIANTAKRYIPLSNFAPVGQSPDGEERLWKHQTEFCEQALPQFMLRIHALKDAATHAVEAARQTSWGPEGAHAAKLALQKHFLESFDFFHGDRWQQCLEQHEQSVRLIISTTTYKLKHEANERLAVQRLLRQKAAGGHVSDEPDMLDFGVTLGACTSSAFLLTASDPSQRMRPAQERNELRIGANPKAEENVNTWISHASVEMRLMETMRHGYRVTRLLSATFPDKYPDLSSASDAPDTTVHTVFCGTVPWSQATSHAGGVVHWKIFAKISGSKLAPLP